jgi:hypothetical protein
MDLNGNPVTVAGAKALMRAANPDKGESDPLRKVNRLQVIDPLRLLMAWRLEPRGGHEFCAIHYQGIYFHGHLLHKDAPTSSDQISNLI